MIEDMVRNLEPAKALGMTTVWLNGDIEWARRQGFDKPPAYVDRTVADLSDWLDAVIARRGEAASSGKSTTPKAV
jgi:putative hydrolase of the HAD superfamily